MGGLVLLMAHFCFVCKISFFLEFEVVIWWLLILDYTIRYSFLLFDLFGCHSFIPPNFSWGDGIYSEMANLDWEVPQKAGGMVKLRGLKKAEGLGSFLWKNKFFPHSIWTKSKMLLLFSPDPGSEGGWTLDKAEGNGKAGGIKKKLGGWHPIGNYG